MSDTSCSRMLLQMNRLSLKSPLRLLTVLVFHLLTHSCKGQSQLIGPSRPIVAIVGDDIILPCYLEPAEDVTADILEWTRSDLKPGFVHVLRSGQDLENARNPSYKGRTSLIIEELKHGNISLKLSKVKLSDKGTYKCDIPIRDKQAFVELVVASDSASSPVVSLAGLDRGGVVLQCECKGWYPEPEVLWLDGEGNLLSAGPTETVRGPDDLYTVSSRVTVEKRHSNSFTCRVQQNHINQTRDTHIHVADDFFKVQSSSFLVIIGLAVSLAVCIVFIVFFGCKWRQNKTKRNYMDKTENKNISESNDAATQPLTQEEEKTKHYKCEQQLQEQQRRREEAEREVQKLKEELKTKNMKFKEQRSKQQLQEKPEEEKKTLKQEVENKCALFREFLQLLEEHQERERDLQSLKKKLETTNQELETTRAELAQYYSFSTSIAKMKLVENEEQTLKKLQTLTKELQTKEKEFETSNKKLQEKKARSAEALKL